MVTKHWRHLLAAVALGLVASDELSAQDGKALFTQLCSTCHEGGNERAPRVEVLRQLAPEQVLAALETGSMITMAAHKGTADHRAIAEYVTGKPFGKPLDTTPPAAAMCAQTATPKAWTNPASADVSQTNAWNGWGVTSSNARFANRTVAGLTAADVPKLKVKWAFAFPGDLSASAQPAVVGSRVFVGSAGSLFYSLSAATGCIHWYFKTAAPVRGAPSVGSIKTASGARYAVFVGDRAANLYALDALTGEVIWRKKVDEHPLARITGSVMLYQGRIYLGTSSGEEVGATTAGYECCKFRGSVMAVNADTGEPVWKTYTVDEPQPTRKDKNGVQLWGPSGAPVWSSPTIDPLRRAVYVTTGDNYSDPATTTSDAFLAFDLDTGKLLWSRQMTANDAYNSACRMTDTTACPATNGPDFDFASSSILVDLGQGHRVLVAGQKSGFVHAVDPDHDGALLWSVRLGKGGTLGGIQWGSAADNKNIYVALSDMGRIVVQGNPNTDVDPKAGGGMFALKLGTGETAWHTPPADCGLRARCSPAQLAAVSAIDGIAFSGSADGHLRGYSTRDGKVVWDFDSVRTYEAVGGLTGRGGSMDGPGPAIAGGMLIVNSGYIGNGEIPGNVLLGLSVDGK
ncbi:MAG TPA: PQQ-binding-like beta-propeller repeat protein [Candidatus Acidoferrum sp.]|nr:PQQ-binding-like beta-propeller repeat protein [Candidatus Acidoferrum sp.]